MILQKISKVRRMASVQCLISNALLLTHWSVRQKLIPRLHDRANIEQT